MNLLRFAGALLIFLTLLSSYRFLFLLSIIESITMLTIFEDGPFKLPHLHAGLLRIAILIGIHSIAAAFLITKVLSYISLLF